MAAMNETKVFKGRDGWEAKARFEMPELLPYRGKLHEDGQPRLSITTSKDSGGRLSSCASVMWYADGIETFVIFGDFMVWPIREKARCTEKSVTEQQARAVAMLDELKARAIAFYAAKIDDAE